MNITKKDKFIAILIVIIVVFLSLFFLANTIRILLYRKGDPRDIIYVSNVKDDLIYDIVLTPNNYIDNEEVDDGLSYITSLIEYINVNFVYNYQGDEDVSLDYDYYIKANIVSNYIEKINQPTLKPVWNKEFILLDRKYGNTSNSQIKITKQLKVGLKFYNDLINQFSNELDLPVDSVLEIKLVVNVSGKLENNQVLKKEHYMLMSIPLNVKAFDITTSKNFVEEEIIYSKANLKTETSYMLAIINICLTIGTIYLGTYLVRRRCNNNKCKYFLEKSRLLKEYDDRIVVVRSFINYSKYDIVDIVSFDELINLSNETYEPIIYWERKEKGINESWYTIIRNKIIYRYVMSKKDMSAS